MFWGEGLALKLDMKDILKEVLLKNMSTSMSCFKVEPLYMRRNRVAMDWIFYSDQVDSFLVFLSF